MSAVGRVLIFVLFCAFASGDESTKEDNTDSFMFRLIWKCANTEDMGNCLKFKAVKVLDQVVRMKEPLVVTEFLSLPRDPRAPELSPKGLNDSEADLLMERRKEEGQGEYLDRVIWSKLVSLFTTRTIQLNLPSAVFEGRGKEDKFFKKSHGFFLMTAMMGGMMLKMAMGKIALIAGKALIVAKIALVLSLILALRRFANRLGGAPEVILTSSELATGRSFASDPYRKGDGADLAYNAHRPKTYNTL